MGESNTVLSAPIQYIGTYNSIALTNQFRAQQGKKSGLFFSVERYNVLHDS